MKLKKNSKALNAIFKAEEDFKRTELLTYFDPKTLESQLDKVSNIVPKVLKHFPQPSYMSSFIMVKVMTTFIRLYEFNNIFYDVEYVNYDML